MNIELKIIPFNHNNFDAQKVEIIIDGIKKGEYIYEYTGTTPPFEYFQYTDGNWYALYSTDYTATRVMKLPECEDCFGEDGDTFGFCPVEFFVPSRQYLMDKYKERSKTGLFDIAGKIGFVQGCVWGDDSYFKLKIINFEESFKQKKLVFINSVGYLPLYYGDLKDLIDFYYFNMKYNHPYINIRIPGIDINISSTLNLDIKHYESQYIKIDEDRYLVSCDYPFYRELDKEGFEEFSQYHKMVNLQERKP